MSPVNPPETPAGTRRRRARREPRSEDELDSSHGASRRSPALSVNLFWRTFLLLALLLTGGVVAWIQTFRQMELEPRATLASLQLASLVNVTRVALRHADEPGRAALMKALSEQEGVRLLARSPSDTPEPLGADRFTRLMAADLQRRLGSDTPLARRINGDEALWIGFEIDNTPVWLRADADRLQPLPDSSTWFIWVVIALSATLLGSAVFARLINKPLKQLSFAASRIRGGEYDSHLDESDITTEIRTVNIGFNRMARELAKVDEERAVMLAGISHDLRTPLARLRLEAEISVADEEARRNMADDIDQLDAIIDKFMDYARPGDTHMAPVDLTAVVEREAAAFRDTSQIQFSLRLPAGLKVMGDDTELGRVFANLFENARRYGRTVETGIAKVKVSHVLSGEWVIVTVRDYGQGVAPEKLPHLTTPFYRGDAARTAATGAGLGLSVVNKALQRIEGDLALANARDGGLMAHLRLKAG